MENALVVSDLKSKHHKCDFRLKRVENRFLGVRRVEVWIITTFQTNLYQIVGKKLIENDI